MAITTTQGNNDILGNPSSGGQPFGTRGLESFTTRGIGNINDINDIIKQLRATGNVSQETIDLAIQILGAKLSDIQRKADSNLKSEAVKIADAIINERTQRDRILKTIETSGKIFSRFNVVDEIVPNVKTDVSSALWSDSTASLVSFYTSSTQNSSSKQYYIASYNYPTTSVQSYAQFAIAYGHRLGSGSLAQNYDSPSKAVYSQYRNLLLTPSDTQFSFAGSANSDSVYVLTFSRELIKEKLDPGNWELVLSGSSGIIRLIDDSSSTTSVTTNESGRIFNVVSGTIANQTTATIAHSADSQPGGGYGLVYPDLGIIVLNGTILDASASLGTDLSSNVDAENHMLLWGQISASSAYALANNDELTGSLGWSAQQVIDGFGFAARAQESITSTHYFVHVKNSDYNYSNNPTFVTGSVGDLRFNDFIENPNVYITAVGLYNDRNELLAVGKLSQPTLKNFTNEVNIKIRLDF